MLNIKARKTDFHSLIRLAWPLILSNLCIPLLGFIDTALLGHLPNPNDLSAAAIGASICVLILSSFNFLRMSSTGLSAQAFGVNDKAMASTHLQQGLLLAMLIGVVIIALNQPLTELALRLMAINEPLYSLSENYCRIRLLAAPASLATFVLVGFAIGQQQSKIALWVLLFSAALNAAGDILFIHVFALNSAGAAIASVIAEYASCLLAIFLCLKYFPFVKNQKTPRGPVFIPSSLTLNGDLFIRSACLMLMFASFHALGEKLGPVTVAANAILLQLILFQSYVLDGIAQATEAKVGEYAHNHSGQLAQILKASCLLSATVAALLVILLLPFYEVIVPLFTNLDPVQKAAKQFLLIAIFMPLLSHWAYWLDGVAVGLTAGKAMRNSMILAGIIYVASLLLMSFGAQFTNHHLWISFVFFSLTRAVFLALSLKTKDK